MPNQKRMIINNRERLVSTDSNRGWAFNAATMAEALRRLTNDRLGPFYHKPGISFPSSGSPPANLPLAADVFGGLEVIVDNAVSLFVEPGVVGVWNGDPGTDDSGYLLCVDPGVSQAGVLAFTPNVSGVVRIDVIECQPTDATLEASNRDIFQPALDMFVPAAVDKVKAPRLTYRIRTGPTDGSYVGYATGWLPLAVAYVQPGAAGWTQVDFYDVRPIVRQRSKGYEGEVISSSQFRMLRELKIWAPPDDGNSALILGWTDLDLWTGYRGGGQLENNVPTSLGNFGSATAPNGGAMNLFDQRATANRVNGFVVPSGGELYKLGLFYPSLSYQSSELLPRWVRYSQLPGTGSPARRRPRGPNGILLLFDGSDERNGMITPRLLQAANFGAMASAWGVIIGAMIKKSLTFGDVVGTRSMQYAGTPGPLPIAADAITGGSLCRWQLPKPANHPSSSTMVRGKVVFQVSGLPPNSDVHATIAVDIGYGISPVQAFSLMTDFRLSSTSAPAGTAEFVLHLDQIPLVGPTYPAAFSSPDTQLWIDCVTVGTINSAELTIKGWQLF